MANRLKKAAAKKAPDPNKLIEEKEEQVEWKSLARDERTFKIIGVISLLLALFLFIAFSSYLFTWNEDQDKVRQQGLRFLVAEDTRAANLLGRLGAYLSHIFIYKGFGLASFLLCSFFFVLGINLLYGRKVFSLVRNLQYVFLGLVVFSLLFAFFFRNSEFAWGGAFGNLVIGKISRFAGEAGTGIIISALALSYIIWRFNPAFRLPGEKKIKEAEINQEKTGKRETGFDNGLDEEVARMKEDIEMATNKNSSKSNNLKGDGGALIINPSVEEKTIDPGLELVEKEVSEETDIVDVELKQAAIAETEKTDIAVEDFNNTSLNIPPVAKEKKTKVKEDVELEIKEGPEEEEAEEEIQDKKQAVLPPYEPTLDLRDYKYPVLDLLENHGSEKIVQDPQELETNKNQIITTLRNYDIAIQKISATIGPTVTLYEIVPAPGVRISRIKNLEDDIALSLAALGIRIIAPIPGKGTIGIEVPNIKKTVVSMKTLLASEKFQHNSFSLPIGLGKKIDNENFIVDLATMPHLLMAGATGHNSNWFWLIPRK
jgi:DNA segregation ATPase FtsK/SpoIIIE, S-DNA-T family